NKGTRHAKGDVILFTDADCRAAGDWLEQMTGPFNGHSDIVGVKGLYKTKQKGVIARFVQLEYEDKYDLMRKEQYIDFIDTYAAGFRQKIFLEMDGYDTNFPVACAEDVDLSYRLANDGYKMAFVPEAVVYHLHPDTLGDYLKKKFKFACWRILAVKKSPNKAVKDSHTPQIMKFQVVLVPLIFLSIIVGLGLRLYSVPIVVILIYFATTIPFTIKAIKKDIIVGLLSPFLLLARSLAQFWGILYGLLKVRF
ncbi:MAG: glycosyltransferase family 2 protein, partial [Planctomycetota bacterium]